jgi:hypothetical protein
MSTTVCIATSTLFYPQGGGHLWVFLNWALGLRELGCRVVWLEVIWDDVMDEARRLMPELRSRLERYDVTEIAIGSGSGRPLAAGPDIGCLRAEDVARDADLLLNFENELSPFELRRFRRSAFVDIDPGLRQLWIRAAKVPLAAHDHYFTIGETVGSPSARFPDCGLRWQYTPPTVFLPAWSVTNAGPSAPYTTLAHWWGGVDQIDGLTLDTDKRTAFLAYIDIPAQIPTRLELALGAGELIEQERVLWTAHGWEVSDAWERAPTPWDYQRFIGGSRGEFSCAKPSYVQLETAWISDRTLCYLASGKPAVVQHTGASRILPDAEGLLRFRTPTEAIERLRQAETDYERHACAARRLAEEHFDATRVAADVLERALD